jgi:hypothetical protein
MRAPDAATFHGRAQKYVATTLGQHLWINPVDVAKMEDFGLVRVVEPAQDKRLTNAAAAVRARRLGKVTDRYFSDFDPAGFAIDRARNSAQFAEFDVPVGDVKIRVKRGHSEITVAGISVAHTDLAPAVREQLNAMNEMIDALDADQAMAMVGNARATVASAITAVMYDRAWRDRLVTDGERRAKRGGA